MWRKQGETKSVAVPEREPAPAIVPERPAAVAPEPRGEPTRIAQSITVKGDLSGGEDLFFDGTLEGGMRLADSRVVIGPNGRVQADIEANEIVVEGQVTGNLHARTRVELRHTSRVRGDIVSERVAIQDGARFNGRIEVVREGAAHVTRATSAPAGGESYQAVPLSAAGEQ